jgi:hypothetical protein
MNNTAENAKQAEPISYPRLPLWSDDFDMDLLKLFPEMRAVPIVAEADKLLVYTYGSQSRDKKVFSHPSTWNGVGSLYFTEPPEFLRDDKSGFVCLPNGYVTNDALCCISAFDAIRDTWCHDLNLMLNWEPWIPEPDYHNVFSSIMSHVRNWSHEKNIHQLMNQARDWALTACVRAGQIVGSAATPHCKKCQSYHPLGTPCITKS